MTLSRRRSYRNLMREPAWGLFIGDRIIASVRATHAHEARDIFKKHGLEGERVKRLFTSNS